MKKLLITLFICSPAVTHAQPNVPTDSIASELKEIVVTADAQTETAKKVIIRPTEQDKKHSTNGYSLLENLNLPDFNVKATSQSISTITGRNVIILVNGVEVQSDELATLAASEITQIDYQRNPGGRYAGNGAVINFLTKRYDFGGNIYLSADEGLARQYGEYIGMANYKKKAVTVTLTASAKWDQLSQLTRADNKFILNDGVLNQTIIPIENKTSTNSQYINLKFTNAAENHSFDIALALTRSATTKNIKTDSVLYTGLQHFTSSATRFSNESGLSPALKLHYNLYLPSGHTFTANATIRYGHTGFNSRYSESDRLELRYNTMENNMLASATLGYFKSFANSLTLGTTVDEYYNLYRDIYSGSFNSTQTLMNNHAMAMLHVDQSLPFGLSYYASAGLTDLYSTIGAYTDNQLSPMAFYGLTYSVTHKHTFSITGNYAHSIFNPSYKNNAIMQTSWFEVTLGNPELKQLKVFQNFISYNGHAGHFGFSLTYDYLKYFGNTSNRYFSENNIMYHQLINDGSFHYHKLIFGLSANFINNKLRIRTNAIYSLNRFDSTYRPARSNDWRADFSASYMFGDWQVKGSYALPYAVLGIEGAKIHNPAQYGLSLSWQKGNWAAECCLENIFDQRLTTLSDANYIVYQSHSRCLSDLQGRNISLTITYMLPYGKKTEPEHIQTETSINSAILRPF